MANEIVKYSNQFNAQALRRFTALDLDLLMAIAARVRDKEIDEVTFTFEELRQLAHVKKNLTDKELAARIVEVNDRLLACRFRFQDDSRTVQFTLFSGFETDWKTAKLLVAVNPRFSFLLNDLTSQFTRFELAEFTALKSSYAKETYRRLKQYRQTGVWKVSLEEFRRLLDVPKSYRTCDLNERVLKPSEPPRPYGRGFRAFRRDDCFRHGYMTSYEVMPRFRGLLHARRRSSVGRLAWPGDI